MNNILQQAHNLFVHGRFKEVITLIAPLLNDQPNNPIFNKIMGLCYKDLHDSLLAIKYLNQSLKYQAKQHDLENIVGTIYKKLNKPELAIKHYQNAISIDGDNVNYLNNLGFMLINVQSYDQAEQCFIKSLKIKCDQANARIGLASSYNLNNNEFKAKELLKEVISDNPNNFIATYNLALICKKLKSYDEALSYFKSANAIKPNVTSLLENLGFLYYENNQVELAITAFKDGLKANPTDVALNSALARVLWEQGSKDFLSHYQTRKVSEMTIDLAIDYYFKLMKVGDIGKAGEVLSTIESTYENSLMVIIARSQFLYENKDYQKGYSTLINLQKIRPLVAAELDWLARHAFALGKYDEVIKIYEDLIIVEPDHQGYWCLLSTALREQDYGRFENLTLYNELIFIVDIDLPDGYDNIEKFNVELMAELKTTHISNHQPLEQSLVGGTQTIGNLFTGSKTNVEKLENSLKATITKTLNKLPHRITHPTLKHANSDFKFSGAWSVWLTSSGFHKSHYHSEGWYSGVYYVNTPDESDLKQGAGYLKIGEPDIILPSQHDAEYYIKPKSGQLVLFPSFLWHGTVPFKSKTPRVTVAFDITPQSKK